jgi:hypothetical protein
MKLTTLKYRVNLGITHWTPFVIEVTLNFCQNLIFLFEIIIIFNIFEYVLVLKIN